MKKMQKELWRIKLMTSDITTRLINMCKDASMIQSKAGYKLGDRVIVLMDNDLDVIIAPNMHVKMSDNATSIPFGAIPKKFVVWIDWSCSVKVLKC